MEELIQQYIDEHKIKKDKVIPLSEYDRVISCIFEELNKDSEDILDVIINEVNKSDIDIEDFTEYLSTQHGSIQKLKELLHDNNICKYIKIKRDVT